jgi:hypothetical protein
MKPKTSTDSQLKRLKPLATANSLLASTVEDHVDALCGAFEHGGGKHFYALGVRDHPRQEGNLAVAAVFAEVCGLALPTQDLAAALNRAADMTRRAHNLKTC